MKSIAKLSKVLKMSFIEVSPESHFPLENLPFGVFSTKSNVSSDKTLELEILKVNLTHSLNQGLELRSGITF